MPGMTKRLEKLFVRAERVITNGQGSPDVTTALGKFGYTPERWAEGQGLLDIAKAAVRADETAMANQLKATNTFNTVFDEVWDQGQTLAQLSATLFEDDTETLILLGLHKRRDDETGGREMVWVSNIRTFGAFLPWARTLYQVAQSNTPVTTLLADFGYSVERLAEEASELETMAAAKSGQEIAISQSRQSTIARDEAADALRVWLFRTEKIAKLALKGKKELLGLLGL